MSKLEPCPFECVMIISDGFKGWSNIIHAKTGIPLAMANPMMTRAFKTLIKVWDTRQPALSVEEIAEIVVSKCLNKTCFGGQMKEQSKLKVKDLAQAIHNRITGGKL